MTFTGDELLLNQHQSDGDSEDGCGEWLPDARLTKPNLIQPLCGSCVSDSGLQLAIHTSNHFRGRVSKRVAAII